MKILTSIIISMFSLTLVKAQGQCSKFYPMKEGVKITLTAFQANHDTTPVSFNEMGTFSYDVVDVTSNSALYKVSMSMGSMSQNSEHAITCTADGVTIDYRSMSSGLLAKYGGGADDKVEITGDNIYLPNDLENRPTLDPASMKMSVNISAGGGGVPMNMSIDMVNRAVVGKETVETPAGKYECYVLKHKMLFNGADIGSYTKQWIAKDVGVVKIEEYTDDGVIQSRMLLTLAEGI